MRSLSPREYTYLGLLIVVGIVAAIYLPGSSSSRGSLSDQKLDPLEDAAPVVNMALLERDPDAFDTQNRNIFDYYVPPPPRREPPPPPPPREPPPPPPKRGPSRAAPPKPVVNLRNPPNPNFTYLGYLGPKDEKIAVFEFSGEVLLAAAGETVQDPFKVVGFGFETVVIGYTDPEWADRTTELAQKGGR